jgi:hypothetical protein
VFERPFMSKALRTALDVETRAAPAADSEPVLVPRRAS